MDNIRTKEDVREYARLLKNFYGELYTYIIVNGGLVLVWLFSGAGYFWPIWPIGIWGISLLIKASKLQVIDSSFYKHCHAVRERVVFLKKDWEEQKVNELLKQAKEKGILKDEKEVTAIKKELNKQNTLEDDISRQINQAEDNLKKGAGAKKAATGKGSAKQTAAKGAPSPKVASAKKSSATKTASAPKKKTTSTPKSPTPKTTPSKKA